MKQHLNFSNKNNVLLDEKDSLINVQPEEENIQIPGELKGLNGSLDLQDERGVR